mmetsp:Transcript_10659/g.15906  ORF Transcript_10659/g.15906 Transcript_10659/m.15906 type:complete len:126 (-) Transcript_10659:1418-1795(-)
MIEGMIEEMIDGKEIEMKIDMVVTMKVVEVVPIHLRALCPGEGNHVQNIRESHPEGEETRLVLDMIEEGITEIEEIVGTVGTAGIGDTGITGITGTEDGMILGEEKKEGLELSGRLREISIQRGQ